MSVSSNLLVTIVAILAVMTLNIRLININYVIIMLIRSAYFF